jgi:protease-4
VGGDYADSFGVAGKMSPAQSAAFGAWMDRIYNGFVARVAEGRRLTVERVQQIAKGHIWTGVQAKELGLVDELGGFPDAVARAKALAGISGQAQLKRFTTAPNAFEAIARLFGASGQSARLMAAASDLAADPEARAVLQDLHDARLRRAGATVLAPIPAFNPR